jgi:hypothetical protein
MAAITGSVGRNGQNRPDDVRTVQTLLSNWNHVFLYGSKCLLVNGEANASTIHEIEQFERNVLNLTPTGLVSPSTRVWDALAAGEPWTSLSWRPPQTRRGRGEAWVRRTFGDFDWTPRPATTPRQAITILGNWRRDNIQDVDVPQVNNIPTYGDRRMGNSIRFHRLAAAQLQALWAEWEHVGLLRLVIFWGGSFVPRYRTGSTTGLSNHSWGTAFDINTETNGWGVRPPGLGRPGCLLPLVPIAERHGFAWGGFFNTFDGMHFEIAEVFP